MRKIMIFIMFVIVTITTFSMSKAPDCVLKADCSKATMMEKIPPAYLDHSFQESWDNLMKVLEALNKEDEGKKSRKSYNSAGWFK